MSNSTYNSNYEFNLMSKLTHNKLLVQFNGQISSQFSNLISKLVTHKHFFAAYSNELISTVIQLMSKLTHNKLLVM